MINSRSLDDLRADVRVNAEAWLKECKKQGLNVMVTQTLRDDEYQALLYSQGRTRPGQVVTNSKVTTFHGKGLALDFCEARPGREYADLAFFRKCGEIAKKMGFTWGGDWKSFPDRPHIQWDAHGRWSGSMLRVGSLPPGMPRYETAKPKTEEEEMVYYKTLKDVPSWYKDAVQKCVDKGALRGDKNGVLDVSEDLCRILTVLDRLGKL